MKKDNWEIKKLGEVFDLHMGKTPSRNNKSYWNNGTHKWLSIADMNNIKYIVETKEKISNNAVVNCNMKIVPKNTVLMSFKLSVGKVAITKEPIFTNEAIMSFRNKSDYEISNEYLYYCLLGKDWEGENRAVMGKTLNKSTLSQNTIPIPPLPVQEAIVKELDTLHRLKELQKQQIDEYDTLAQATFYSMFGDPIDNEKGWEVKKLGEVCEKKGEYGSGSSAITYDENKPRYIRITDINDNGELNDDKVSPSNASDYGKYKLHDGDILFARSGATVGKTYLHSKKNGNCIYAGYLIRFKVDKKILLPKFVFFYTKTNYYSNWVNSQRRVVAQPNINAKQYGNLSIYIPPLSLQDQFAERIEKIEAQKELVKQSITETQTLIDYTMDKYFG